MTVVRVTLSPDLSQFVEAEVLRGDYNSVSAVVDQALRLMKAEREREAEKETALSREVAAGLAEARAGADVDAQHSRYRPGRDRCNGRRLKARLTRLADRDVEAILSDTKKAVRAAPSRKVQFDHRAGIAMALR